MRPEIERYLEQYAPGKDVLVIGPSERKGLNRVKSLIEKLNRDGKWIRCEFGDSLTSHAVTSSVGLVITMFQAKHSSITPAKQTAQKLGIPYIPFVLTLGQVKEILRKLAVMRRPALVGAAFGNLSPGANGNGIPDDDVADDPDIVDEVEHEDTTVLDALQKLGQVLQETENIALSASFEKETLQRRVNELEQDKKDLEELQQQNEALRRENQELRAEAEKFKSTFETLKKMIEAA